MCLFASHPDRSRTSRPRAAENAAQQLVSAKELEGMRAHLATMNHEQEKHRRARAEQVLGLLQQVRV